MSEDTCVRHIARRGSRSASTISREMASNAKPWDDGYDPLMAHLRAHERARPPKAGKIDQSPWLASFMQDKLNKRWSPEQIHLHLRRHHARSPDRQVSVETIYQCLYRPGEGTLSRSLTRQLRTGRSMRRRQRRLDRRTRRLVAAMRSIHDRPGSVDDRRQPGHWEGDLIIGAGGRSAIGTLVERTSRFTKLVPLDGDRAAGTVTPALINALRPVPSHLRRSLTWDQGMEMAEHHLISQALAIEVYFCDPASPWQRGTNENANGLLASPTGGN
jgi:IS30 family transposase